MGGMPMSGRVVDVVVVDLDAGGGGERPGVVVVAGELGGGVVVRELAGEVVDVVGASLGAGDGGGIALRASIAS